MAHSSRIAERGRTAGRRAAWPPTGEDSIHRIVTDGHAMQRSGGKSGGELEVISDEIGELIRSKRFERYCAKSDMTSLGTKENVPAVHACSWQVSLDPWLLKQPQKRHDIFARSNGNVFSGRRAPETRRRDAARVLAEMSRTPSGAASPTALRGDVFVRQPTQES